jgi:hypothetical protein
MPSRPLSADTSAVVRLFTRLEVEAIDLAKHRTEVPAAVPRFLPLVPSAETLVRMVRSVRSPGRWPGASVIGPTDQRQDQSTGCSPSRPSELEPPTVP